VNKRHCGHYRNGAAEWGIKKSRRLFHQLLLVMTFMLFACTVEPQHAWPEVQFKTEFDDICMQTVDADSMSIRELETLIMRCDKLLSIIEKNVEPERKIYLKKLRMCRNLFVYIMETKKSAETESK